MQLPFKCQFVWEAQRRSNPLKEKVAAPPGPSKIADALRVFVFPDRRLINRKSVALVRRIIDAFLAGGKGG